MNEPQSNCSAMKARFVVMRACAAGVALLLPGCAVGPDYQRPAVNSPANFRNAAAAPSTNSLADLPWRELYRDETLDALIRTALANNYDLRIAVARVEEARAIAKQAKAQFVPHAGYEGDVSRGRNEFLGSPNPAGPAGARTGDAVFAALSASWEIDRKSTRLNSSHIPLSRMPSSA